MVDLVEFHGRALTDLDAAIESIGEEDWPRATACEGWSVRDLVGHLTAEALWAPHLLRGETLDEVGDRYDSDVLGADPQAAWREASAAERAAVVAPGALDGTVHTTMGELPAALYLTQRLTDLVVHRWDLAWGLGLGRALPEDIAEYLYRALKPQADELAASGMFAPPVEVPADATPADRLLGLLGRRPELADP